MNQDGSYFFCGIGGSGMLPLARIMAARGHAIAGSDRARDQGRTPEKFAWLQAQGVALFPQDGSGVTEAGQTVVATGAVEETVPDIGAARRVGATVLTRPELLSRLFNASGASVGVAGTSGKSTITGMIAVILDEAGRDPTVVNGAVMRDLVTPDDPYASARVGRADLFVAEVDESDGSIARYDPTVAVVSNVSLDHKSMEELRDLFGGFVRRADRVVLNLDNPETTALAQGLDPARVMTFSLGLGEASLTAKALTPRAEGIDFELIHAQGHARVSLKVPGAHNVANALAALGAALSVGVPIETATRGLERFSGIRRRLEIVGRARGVTVIDDFAHNPDKIAATLKTLHAFPGRLLILFQPHGFGPLKLMRGEFAQGFAGLLRPDDLLVLPDPVYHGGTTDRSVTSADIASDIRALKRRAEALGTREACAERLIAAARSGDRIVVMGARDDTLSQFAAELLERLGA